MKCRHCGAVEFGWWLALYSFFWGLIFCSIISALPFPVPVTEGGKVFVTVENVSDSLFYRKFLKPFYKRSFVAQLLISNLFLLPVGRDAINISIFSNKS